MPSAVENLALSKLRHRMVEDQIRSRGVTDALVLQAMESVPREEFVPRELRDFAYDDRPLPIGREQTISQPYTVAYMCQALKLLGHERVLEIGTGSGYGAAVLSLLARDVYTIERIDTLADSARERLARLGYRNVQVVTGDGTLGLSRHAPYDGIVVTAGAERLPKAYVEQLADGGRIVIPVGEGCQTMYRCTRASDELQMESLGSFSFVPLIGAFGWNESPAEPSAFGAWTSSQEP